MIQCCKYCEKRHDHCHSHCEEYLSEKKAHDKERQSRFIENEINFAIQDIRWSAKKEKRYQNRKKTRYDDGD